MHRKLRPLADRMSPGSSCPGASPKRAEEPRRLPLLWTAIVIVASAGLVATAGLAVVPAAVAHDAAAVAHGDLNYEVSHQTIRGHRVTITTHGDPLSAFKHPGAAALSPPSAETQTGVPASIAPSWCGTPRTNDDTIDESGSRTDPKIRVIYAYPSDAPNNFSTYANMIQSDLKVDFDAVAAASNGTKSLRFDLGTSCGPSYLDITTVALPRPASDYNDFYLIRADLAAALGSSANKRNYLAYTDRIAPSGYGGQGQIIPDDSAGSGNGSNYGGLYAFTYYGSWWSSASPFRREVPLHEVGHNLGAVQLSAPHSSGAWHCFDENDIMCYNDGGSYFANGGALTYSCGLIGSDQPWDCHADDYFSPAPQSGSYLGTHWNVYDSVFLCSLASCTPSGKYTDTTIASGPSGATNDSTPTFSFSSTEPGSTFECRFDADPFAPCSGPGDTHTPASALADGSHTFYVRATDPAGNPDPTPASRSFTIDTVTPNTTISGGPSTTTTDPTPTFSFSSTEPGATFECRFDSDPFGPCSGPGDTHTPASALADGSHTFEVRATDSVGNTDPTPDSRSFTVQTTASTVGCGDTLTKDTKLAADLDCSGLPSGATALTVAGAGIKLDLHGHTIKGPNDPTTFVNGVRAAGSGVAVQGGTITGFSTDVVVFAGAEGKRLTLTDAATGALFGDQGAMSRSTISRVDVGIESESGGEQITHNRITADGRAGDPACADIVGGGRCVAIDLFDGGGALIRNNTISSPGGGISLQGRAVGGDTVRGNAVTCPGSGLGENPCIELFDGLGGNLLAGNSVSAANDEIRITGQSGDTLTANTVGPTIDGSGIVLSAVNDSTLKHNTANDNGDQFDSGGYGISVNGDGNLIEHNTANRNDIDGILSLGANTLTANIARDNHGLGIQALFGAIDGGRNRASGNAFPQCIGVICTP